jgi:hypothetical protein
MLPEIFSSTFDVLMAFFILLALIIVSGRGEHVHLHIIGAAELLLEKEKEYPCYLAPSEE